MEFMIAIFLILFKSVLLCIKMQYCSFFTFLFHVKIIYKLIYVSIVIINIFLVSLYVYHIDKDFYASFFHSFTPCQVFFFLYHSLDGTFNIFLNYKLIIHVAFDILLHSRLYSYTIILYLI